MMTQAITTNVKSAAMVTYSDRQPALQNAIAMWADATTDATSLRRHDLLRDKARAVADFFDSVGRGPDGATAIDVKTWQAALEGRGLAAATVYAMVSRVSSFYNWARADETLRQHISHNPVDLARPRAPRAYQTEATKALDDDEVRALLAVVKARADGGDVVGKRDYALTLFYLLTGLRRSEVIRLRWGDVKVNSHITLTTKAKGGDYQALELLEPAAKAALLDYLETSGRLATMTAETPLWTSHDAANVNPGGALTSHAYVKNLKGYAAAAGLDHIHLHQTRHTFARIVSEDTGSLGETQEALGHRNAATTRVYVQRVGVKRDKHSVRIATRLGV